LIDKNPLPTLKLVQTATLTRQHASLAIVADHERVHPLERHEHELIVTFGMMGILPRMAMYLGDHTELMRSRKASCGTDSGLVGENKARTAPTRRPVTRHDEGVVADVAPKPPNEPFMRLVSCTSLAQKFLSAVNYGCRHDKMAERRSFEKGLVSVHAHAIIPGLLLRWASIAASMSGIVWARETFRTWSHAEGPDHSLCGPPFSL